MTCLRVVGIEKIVEEVFSVNFKTELGSFKSLGFAVCHILGSRGCDLAEEDLVEVVLVDGEMCAALGRWSVHRTVFEWGKALTIRCL